MPKRATLEEPASPATGGARRAQHPTEEPASPATGGSRRLKQTIDHGEIIHFAGRKHLFPVASKTGMRLASREDVKPDETRIGWPAWFRPFIDRRLVFLYRCFDGVEPETSSGRSQPSEGAPNGASVMRLRDGSAPTTSTISSSPTE